MIKDNDDGEEQHFHIEKSISIGHIITTISIIISAVMWTANVEKKLAIHDTQIATLGEQDRAQRIEAQTSRAEILNALQNLDSKLDRYIEKVRK